MNSDTIKVQSVSVSGCYIPRLQIFQPTRLPVMLTGEWIETTWGKIRVKGKIGQKHLNLLEIILKNYLEVFHEQSGRCFLLVDPYIIRKKMSKNNDLSCYKTTQKLIEDLRKTDIEWILKDGNSGGIDSILGAFQWANEKYDKKNIHGKNFNGSEKRHLWKITINSVYMKLLNILPLNYDPEKILKLQYSSTQALVRFMLSHKKGAKYELSKVLSFIGFEEKQISKAIFNIKKDIPYLNEFGIVIENGFVELKGVANEINKD